VYTGKYGTTKWQQFTSNTVEDTESEKVSASDSDAPSMMKKMA